MSHVQTRSPRLYGTERSSLHAIVVTYNPDDEFVSRLERLVAQFDKVWIVNNGTPLQLPDTFAGAKTTHAVTVVEMQGNAGIAAAINAGARAAAEDDANWAALFDQDSICPDGFAEAGFAAIDWAADQPRVALFAPMFADSGNIYQRPQNPDVERYPMIEEAITSGSFVRLSTFLALGGYDESFFIDFVDHDYMLRLNQTGNEARSLPIELIHSIGKGERKCFLGKDFVITNHPPFRLFCSGHNCARIISRHFRSNPRITAKLATRESLRIVKILFFENRSLVKIIAWISGFSCAVTSANHKVTRDDIQRWIR